MSQSNSMRFLSESEAASVTDDKPEIQEVLNNLKRINHPVMKDNLRKQCRSEIRLKSLVD